MENFERQICCCCINLKTGTWLIGGLVCISLLFNVLTALAGGNLYVTIIIELAFCIFFLLNKVSSGRDDYSWRNLVFLYYLGGIICSSWVWDLIQVFFLGGDVAACGNALIPLCPALVRAWAVLSLAFSLIIQLYFAHCLKVWADNKKEDKQYTIL